MRYNSYLVRPDMNRDGFGGDTKFCTFIVAFVVAKQDSFSFVRTCAKPRNVKLSKNPILLFSLKNFQSFCY